MKYHMLSLGPARMDVFLRLPDVEVEQMCSIDRKKCVIELGFGEKIAVRGVDYAVGGNTGNNAVGLTRLGLQVAMVGSMGDHWTDKEALEILKKEGVDTQYVQTLKDQTGLGVVINYQEERTILSYYPEALTEFKIGSDVEADWIYLTTAGANFEQFYKEAVDWAKSHQAKIGFNPGSRQLGVGRERLRNALENSEVLFVNREEAVKVLNNQYSVITDLLKQLKDLGSKMVVITDGPNGAYFYDGHRMLVMPIVESRVVERTGAGDAFGSGFLAALIYGKSIEEALQWGTCNSASVLGFIGPQAGLLTQPKMQEWLSKAPKTQLLG